MTELWMENIRNLSDRAELNTIDVLVDHAGWGQSVLPALRVLRPVVPWYSLFTGTPEEHLLAHAPILMRLSLDDTSHKAWLQEMLRALGGTSRLTLLLSPLPFEVLARILRDLSRLKDGELLRYFDSRVLATLLNSILSEPQKQRFLQVASLWGWLDRDLRLVWAPGTCTHLVDPQQLTGPIELTDEQFDCLGSVGDALEALAVARELWPGLCAEQCFGRCYSMARRASRKGDVGDLEAYMKEHHFDVWPATRADDVK